MKRTTVQAVDHPRSFDVSELFFSTTDRKGIIATCNDVFVRISGYHAVELIGVPHNKIRHPDMPKSVFKLFWEYLLSGRSIGAYVKNMAQNGEYYWVFALAIPIEGGFLSVRLKPTSELFPKIRDMYQQLLHHEQSYGRDWRTGMVEAEELLLREIQKAGFESYDDFMARALHMELTSRTKHLALEHAPTSTTDIRTLQRVESVFAFREELSHQRAYYSRFGNDINMIALNTSVVAAHLSENGRALGVISLEISHVAKEIMSTSRELLERVESVREGLFGVSFMTSLGSLMAEVSAYFKENNSSSSITEEEHVSRFGAPHEAIEGMLDAVHADAVRTSKKSVAHLQAALREFRAFVDEFSRLLLRLQLGYVMGKSLASSIEGGALFARLLEEVVTLGNTARGEVDSLESAIRSAQTDVGSLGAKMRPGKRLVARSAQRLGA